MARRATSLARSSRTPDIEPDVSITSTSATDGSSCWAGRGMRTGSIGSSTGESAYPPDPNERSSPQTSRPFPSRTTASRRRAWAAGDSSPAGRLERTITAAGSSDAGVQRGGADLPDGRGRAQHRHQRSGGAVGLGRVSYDADADRPLDPDGRHGGSRIDRRAGERRLNREHPRTDQRQWNGGAVQAGSQIDVAAGRGGLAAAQGDVDALRGGRFDREQRGQALADPSGGGKGQAAQQRRGRRPG